MKFTFFHQLDHMDCGATCLQMIAKYYGCYYELKVLRERCHISREGVSFLGLTKAAESIGLRATCSRIDLQTLLYKAPLPCVIHWDENHFVVVVKSPRKSKGGRFKKVVIADPARGMIKYSVTEFSRYWKGQMTAGIVMLLQPTSSFFDSELQSGKRISFSLLRNYLHPYRNLMFQLVLGLLIGTAIQVAVPFLTQSIVDVGINTSNIHFIYVILIAQLMLLAGKISVEFLRNWILLHISSRINLSILSDFLIKLIRLPLSFFDVKRFGDIIQRIEDHRLIEAFLTNSTLSTLFSLFNILFFGIVLCLYNTMIFMVFIGGLGLYLLWVFLFLRHRRQLNYRQFEYCAKEKANLIGLISGMQDIKLANAEQQKRWSWEHIRAELFNMNIRILGSTQYQQLGGFLFNEGKNILITFLAARLVIHGDLTLGAMLSIQYIIGQLSGPVEQLIQFSQAAQDAKISLERMNEIYDQNDEESDENAVTHRLPESRDLSIRGLAFHYPGTELGMSAILKDINLLIPAGKITAIVGASGSGKTTLLKLLLKFYEPSAGNIHIGRTSLRNISHNAWRAECGVVMQDGFIFSDTIAGNIAVGVEYPDDIRLMEAARIANILGYIQSRPLGFNTVIGAEGVGLSQGQRQRILIARAVYKNPEYIFFDEATNALDANNESEIMRNLDTFFKGRTVIIVAHRLSTVKNADQIILLDHGEIAEFGPHEELVHNSGKYYQLVKNQLELGN